MKWKLGELSGIGVYVHWSFWILPGWVLLGALSGGGSFAAALSSVVLVVAVFGCVVLHELGHALMARRYGIGTRDITLYPIGGVARLERLPSRPAHELAIALAGPAVNVAIAGALLFGAILSGAVGAMILPGSSFLVNILWVNVALAVFNLLPAFPMDGGRVLRALLATQLPYLTATRIAVRAGQAIAIVLGVLGLFTGGLLPLVALFVFLAAQAELAAARWRDGFGDFALESAAPPAQAVDRFAGDDRDIVWVSDVHELDEDGRILRIVAYRPDSCR